MADRERWRRVPGWPAYKVSSHGRVKSMPRMLANGRAHGGGELAQSPDREGYLYVTLCDGPRVRRVGVATLVLEAFVGVRPEGMEGCHGPEGNQVNHLSELRWDTRVENERDKRRTEVRNSRGSHRPFIPVTPVTIEVQGCR